MTYEVVTLTTDYGDADGFVAAVKGVILRRASHVRLVDVTHRIPPQDVRRGAAVLAQTVPWLPPAIHLAVVDPGVGTDRRGLCLVAGGSVLVGPDNGLLPPAADALGGIDAGYVLDRADRWLPEVSRTFHGRDVFAPVVGFLAAGGDVAELGSPAADPIRLPVPTVTVEKGWIGTEVLSVDGFGNVQLAATYADLARAGLAVGPAVTLGIGGTRRRVVVGSTFGAVAPGEPVVLVDSAGQVAVAVNGGNAAAAFGARDGDPVSVTHCATGDTSPSEG